MYLRGSGSNWEVRAPAKVNLLLEVLSRRDDGFHEIETLMVPIALFDTLYFTSLPSGSIELDCSGAPGGGPADSRVEDVPQGAENLVVRAVRLLRERAGVRMGASLRLVKRIPTAAGLGGGSSDAAAALVAANLGWKLGWSIEQLTGLAAQLGSDVPFFVGSGGAICRGRGEQVERVGRLAGLPLVIVRPPVGLSTAEVYAACRPAGRRPQFAPLLRALRRGLLAEAGRRMDNRLEAAAAEISPWIGRLKGQFASLGCPAHLMTGSGSGYFGICRSACHARRVAGALRGRRVGRVFHVMSCL